MKPGFRLNCHSRAENPLFESHDPSMMRDPVSGYYYSYSTDTAITSAYQQGIQIRKSKDLVEFSYVGIALSEDAIAEARDNGEGYEKTAGFWAPYVAYIRGEYRMYYSATKAFGSSESKIWLAVAKHPEGPFENRGVVMDTWFTDDTYPNAIDAHLIDDEMGNQYLVYGSFFGGIYLKALNVENGMPVGGDSRSLGRRIAKKPENGKLDGPEGAAIIYNTDTMYYYLFLSYGWLGENYDIRVGRAKCVEGPYVDYSGKNLDEESYGLKIANSYCFEGVNPYAQLGGGWLFKGFRGPGHGVPFWDESDGSYYFVHHIRDGADIFKKVDSGNTHPTSYCMHYMMVRRMAFVRDWPVLSPEPFAGEKLNYIEKQEDTAGKWEWIELDDSNNELKVSYKREVGELLKKGIVLPCFDFEKSKENICITGIDDEGIVFWGKKE